MIAVLTTPSQPSAAQNYLRITELMYHPQKPTSGSYSSDDFEFIELENIGSSTLSLTGVSFTDGVYFNFTGSSVTSLSAGGMVLVVSNKAAFQSRYGHSFDGIIAGQFSNSPGTDDESHLSNGGEHISLDDSLGEAILGFTYNDSWYTQTDGQGNSLVIRDPLEDTSLWNNSDGWAASQSVNGSPGASETPQYAVDSVVINEVMSHTNQPIGDWVELANTTSSSINIGGWYLSNDPADLKKYQIPSGTVLAAGGYVVFNQRNNFGSTSNPGCLEAFFFGEMGDAAYLTSAASSALTGYQASQTFHAAAQRGQFHSIHQEHRRQGLRALQCGHLWHGECPAACRTGRH